MKTYVIVAAALLMLLLAACGKTGQGGETVKQPETEPTETVQTAAPGTEPAETESVQTEPVQTEPVQTEPVETESIETEPIETEPAQTESAETVPEHSELYIPGVSVEDVIVYFNEVCLDSEFSDGGAPTLVQKWIQPIYYSIYGEYTQEDLQVLTAFTEQLNAIEGFPGISQAQEDWQTNLRIHFCTEQEMVNLMGGERFYGLDGAVTYWYDGNNEIYDEIICYRQDIDQYVRNSVILEEIYNGLGLTQDTLLREDSIIYQEYTTPQSLTEVDVLLLKLLYHRDILCGMDAAQCEQVIYNLYY